jgi:hypothetical protein
MTNQSRNQQKYLAAAVTTCAPQARPLVTHLKAGHTFVSRTWKQPHFVASYQDRMLR